jgi:hypothetical protein
MYTNTARWFFLSVRRTRFAIGVFGTGCHMEKPFPWTKWPAWRGSGMERMPMLTGTNGLWRKRKTFFGKLDLRHCSGILGEGTVNSEP